ncbi:hypothetical protein NPIL_693931 [Nephila pilipes]|uniref:Uncharacterized protein n=1 Tax=Nephila pilipes TaxID=299642 RepID=A0A8X6TWB5_NEPPI|nr:hypothetical protein NPIL_693931 [Nephila pilipes]
MSTISSNDIRRRKNRGNFRDNCIRKQMSWLQTVNGNSMLCAIYFQRKHFRSPLHYLGCTDVGWFQLYTVKCPKQRNPNCQPLAIVEHQEREMTE